MVRSVGLEP